MSQIVYTPDAPAAIGPYSQAVVCNGVIFTSGPSAINTLSQKVEATEIEEQTKLREETTETGKRGTQVC